MILLTSATGKTSSATLRALASSDVPIRVLVRDPQRFHAPDGVDVAVGHFEDPASLEAALTGVQRAYLVGPVDEHAVEFETAFVTAAQHAGLDYLVYLSSVGADRPEASGYRFGAFHHTMEEIVRESGIAWTVLRPSVFMQNYLMQAETIATQNTFYSALSPTARVACVDVEDVGAVVAHMLTEDGHQGKAYTLTGPAAISDDDIAARMTEVLGHDIHHVQVPLESIQQSMLGSGVPRWTVDGLVELWELFESGGAAVVSPDIERVLGRPARSISDFVATNRAMFAG